MIYQPLLAPGIGQTWGLGDIQTQLFFCPPTKGIIWGAGPILVYPSATDDVLGTGKLLIGPTAVALTIQGPWLVGLLVNNVFLGRNAYLQAFSNVVRPDNAAKWSLRFQVQFLFPKH